MGDIFREIDEELRQERFEKLWQAYGRYVLAIGIALVLAVVGWKVWDHYRTTQRQANSMQYATAARLIGQGKTNDAAALFANLADRSSGGYHYLARFHQAALRAESGDIDGAVRLYDALASDEDLDRTLREAAVIFAAMLQVDNAKADAGALRARLEPLSAPDGPWRHAARELMGLLALRESDHAAARSQFQAIADDVQAPQAMRARAAQILATLEG